MATEDKKFKAAAQTGAYLVVIAAIAVLANVLSTGVYKRSDVTKNERYTLSRGSGRLIKELKSPIQCDVYVSTGTAKLKSFVRDLTDLMREYERAGAPNFKFTIIEAKTDEQKEAAKEAGLQEMAFADPNASGEDQMQIAQGYMGIVLKYGSEKGVIPQLVPDRGDGLEFWITNKIREIRDKADDIKHRIGVVTGKDELKLGDTNLVPKQGGQKPSLQGIIEQAFPFYKVEEVDLKDGASEIEPELVGLIITQPRKDYSDKELRRIDQFLMRGGKSLVLYVSAVSMKPQDATMNGELKLHGVDKLTEGYGIKMNNDALFDHGAQFRIAVMTQSGQPTWLRHPGLAHVINDVRAEGNEALLDQSFAPFFRLEELMFPFPSSLTLDPSKQPDAKVTAVARTTKQTSTVTGSSVSMDLKTGNWEPKPPMDQQVIAAVAEGKLKSAFGTDDAEIKQNATSPEPSRVLVVAAGEFLTNPFCYAGNGPELGGQFAMFGNIGGDPLLQQICGAYAKHLTNMILSLKNTLDWMAGDSDLVAASAKIIAEPGLAYTSISKPQFSEKDDEASVKKKDEDYKQQRGALQRNVVWTLVLGMPLLIALLGLARWWVRENSRNLKRI